MTEMGEEKGFEEARKRGLTRRITFAELYEAAKNENGVPLEVWLEGHSMELDEDV